MGTITLFVSCKKSSDFQVLNFSDSDWEEVDPFDAHAILMSDVALLLEKYQQHQNLSLSEEEIQVFYERLLQNTQFFKPGEDDEPTMPLTCTGKPVILTEEESLEKQHMLLSWTEGRLSQFQPEAFSEKTKGYFHMLGVKADLNGVAFALTENTKTETPMDSLIRLAIRRNLTDWECRGEAKLYWWTYNNQRSLLYITHRVAIIFCEKSPEEVEVVFCLNRGYFLSRPPRADEEED